MKSKFELIKENGIYADYIYVEVLTNDLDLDDWSNKNEYGEYEENTFINDDEQFIELVKISLDIKERISNKEISLYDGLLELSDNHTLWEIDAPDFDIEMYWEDVSRLAENFETETGVKLYFEGRSGRHVCVENTLSNAFQYDALCELQQRYEKTLIKIYS